MLGVPGVGTLRWLSGVARGVIDFLKREVLSLRGASLLTVHAATAYVAYWALAVPPDGPWDEDNLTGIEMGCALMILSAALTLALSVAPVRHRRLHPWWLAPPPLYLTLGAGRWAYIAHAYPVAVGRGG
ncbi:hypothetical protein [Streptomyces thermolilacinus]|uniref:Uncharacterized protein n=1 Tax=Streptomyces thermolilacinus SPC6 TaxID=1306406 RepID=A0A1D3DRA3_9ACTN|nr:hypothetical protein [Streptomyces thermolilacinus]OEJ94846.1 hypothetical protein J116_010490 [Streptomyces thermolilacinus SPC6]